MPEGCHALPPGMPRVSGVHLNVSGKMAEGTGQIVPPATPVVGNDALALGQVVEMEVVAIGSTTV